MLDRNSKPQKSPEEQLQEREIRLKQKFNIQIYTQILKTYEEEIRPINFNTIELDYAEDAQSFAANLFNEGKVFKLLSDFNKTISALKQDHQSKVENLYSTLNKLEIIKQPSTISHFYTIIDTLIQDSEFFFDPDFGYNEHFLKYRDIYNKLSHAKYLYQHVSQLIYDDIGFSNPSLNSTEKQEYYKNKIDYKKSILQKEIQLIVKQLFTFSHTPLMEDIILKFPDIQMIDNFISNLDKIIGKLRIELIHFLNDIHAYKIPEYKNLDYSLTDLVYKLLINLAELEPINKEDFISLEEIDPCSQVFSSTGNRFDLLGLIEFHHQRFYRGRELGEFAYSKKLIDPSTNTVFSFSDTVYIISEAHKRDFYITYLNLSDIPLNKLVMSGPEMAERILKTPQLLNELFKNLKSIDRLLINQIAFSHQKTAFLILNNHGLYKMFLANNSDEEIIQILEYLGKLHINHARSFINDKKYNKYISPLHFSIKCCHIDLINEQLLNSEIELESKHYGTPLYTAAQTGNEFIVQLILEKGASFDKPCAYGTPLYAAAASGHFNLVKLFTKLGADINAISPNSKITPLLASIKNQHKEIANHLISLGAPLHPTIVSSTTYYEIMLSHGYTQYIQEEFTQLKDLNNVINTILPIAANCNCLEIIQYFIKNNITLNYKNYEIVEQSLRSAITKNHHEITMALILLLDNPYLTISDITSDSRVLNSIDNETSNLLLTAKTFWRVISEMNRPIFDYSRLNYKSLLISCFTLNKDLTFAMYLQALEQSKCPNKFTFYLKNAAEDLSLFEIKNKILEIEKEISGKNNHLLESNSNKQPYNPKLFKKDIELKNQPCLTSSHHSNLKNT